MSTTYRVAVGISHGSVKTCILAPFLRVLRAPLPGSTPTATRYALTGGRGVRAAPPRDPPRSSPAAILPCRRAPAGTLTLHVAEAKWTRRRQRPGLRDSFAGRRMVAWGSAKRGLTLDRGGAWRRALISPKALPISNITTILTALPISYSALARRARPCTSVWSILAAAPLRTANRAGRATLWPVSLLDGVLIPGLGQHIADTYGRNAAPLFNDVRDRWSVDELSA